MANITHADRITIEDVLRAYLKAGTRNKAANECGRHRSSPQFAKRWREAKRKGYIRYLGGQKGHEVTEKGYELLRNDQ